MKKILMIAASGLLAPAAVGTAHAEFGIQSNVIVNPYAKNDLAPVSGDPQRLRRTDEEQPGNEMPAAILGKDGKTGFYFVAATELPPTVAGGPVRPANERVQLAKIPFSLVQDATTGLVKVEARPELGEFVTNNDGNEYRNSNNTTATHLFDGAVILAEYNYQPDNSSDTIRWAQAFDSTTGVRVMDQTEIYAKNNDDCSMHKDGEQSFIKVASATENYVVAYRGCNGNGRDDGWISVTKYARDTATGAVTATKMDDLSLAPREERSRGNCSASAADRNTAICTWTEGNTQPQRDGTWIAAVDVSDPADISLLWKKQLNGRKDIDGVRTYAMRAMHERVQTVDAATGLLVDTNRIVYRDGDLRGNNNTNGKGGTYYRSNMSVIEATATGMKYLTPQTDMAPNLIGLDGTHLGMTFGLFGTTNALTPGIVFLGGSHTGGGTAAQARFVSLDTATNTFADAGMVGLAPHDRHLYPNYLGNNPGNQGRNHSAMRMIANPYVGMNGNNDAYLLMVASTGKAAEDMMFPQRKLSAFLTVVPIAQTPKTTTPGGGSGGGGGGGGGGGEDGGDDGTGTALGGCSTSNTPAGLATFLLIGLAAFLRRRR